MFELMIMRHAKSDWDNNKPDISRPLSSRGCKDTGRMATYLNSNHLTPDRLVVSSALRTRQTADLLLAQLQIPQDNTLFIDSLYLASMNTLLATVEHYAEDNRRLMLLAHNPGVDDLVTYLAGTPPPLTGSGKLMVTSAIALFKVDSLNSLSKPGEGNLISLIRPGELA